MAGRQHRAPLAENEGLAFAGVRVRQGLIVDPDEAERMLAARNRHGKPNADVIRPYVDAEAMRMLLSGGAACPHDAFRNGQISGRVEGNATHLGNGSPSWIVDFPADMTPEEASLYEQPWHLWEQAGGVLHARADPMRIAVSRIEWFLAAPAGRALRGFAHFETPMLPGAGLVVIASDDDFVAAVLNSGVFDAWVHAHGGRLRVRHIASFPFPWAPRTERGALTREQLELRDRVMRASADDLDDAAAAAYGWRDIASEADLIHRLRRAHESRRSGI